MQICVGGHGSVDFLAWNFTKSGEFTGKSAYHLCMEKKRARAGQLGSSSSTTTHQGWLSLGDPKLLAKHRSMHGDLSRMASRWALNFYDDTSRGTFFVVHVGEKKCYIIAFGPTTIQQCFGRSWARYWVQWWRSHLYL